MRAITPDEKEKLFQEIQREGQHIFRADSPFAEICDEFQQAGRAFIYIVKNAGHKSLFRIVPKQNP